MVLMFRLHRVTCHAARNTSPLRTHPKRHSKGKQRTNVTFQEKIKIAIGIGEGVRYMHEECPRGPIVHGDLRPCNIFLNFDLEPQITGFGNATWLHLKQGLPISSNSSHFYTAIRSLFSKYLPLSQARPLLLQRAFHKLLDEDMEDLDVYGIFRVMCVASQCINTKPISRPIIESSSSRLEYPKTRLIISVLKGETSCAMQLSPSSEGSPNMDFSGSSIGRLIFAFFEIVLVRQFSMAINYYVCCHVRKIFISSSCSPFLLRHEYI
ncbi:hypothetical protein HYC85_024831 [Camellia sinensis]|uniref:Protein kinase domain-containing protein n=1 Tax=Camellia sinensis TaxID=4442 RepID=A0A7J7GAL3_CAMSI|nr:hypothetical protein HYC85_024831 [Camellia sinensis]